ncbi:MAG: hypothetical protein KGQ86_02950 [Bacteroidetes bacterium]|nr:hypothetical protein [Bacteroidota bacterium]
MAEEALKEFGLLKSAEDSGYPFYTVEIEFPERKFSEIFTINLAELPDVDPGLLTGWVGKYVSFEYTSEIVNALLDIRQNGKSLLGVNPSELPKGLKKISGTLSGAANVTEGDLPSVLRIHDPEDQSIEFEFFITPELVEADGTLVVGYYDQRTNNRITAISPAKE